MARKPTRSTTCPRCGARLARDNTSGRCAPCDAAERDRLVTPPNLPADFWDHEPIRRAATERHFGRLIRAYRNHPYHGHRPLPQETVGRWLGITQAQLSRLENRGPVVHLDRLTHWAQILRIPAHLLWFKLPNDEVSRVANSVAQVTGRKPVRAEISLPGQSTDVYSQLEGLRQEITNAVTGSSVSAACLDNWEQVVLSHGEATRHLPARAQFQELSTDFGEIRRLFDCRMASSSLRRLTRITAQMAGLMFLTLIKMGKAAHARQWIRIARNAADEAGDSVIRCWVRGQEAYVHFYRKDFVAAIAAAEEAQAIGQRAQCAGVPLAAALQARAEARLGRFQAARSALGRAEIGLAALAPDTTASSAFGYDEAQLRFHEGNTYTHLRCLPAARAAQEAALALYPPRDFLDRALVGLDQALCLVYEGDPDAAAMATVTTLVSLSEAQRSGLLLTRAREVYDAMPVPARRHGPVADLYDILTVASPRERA